MEFVRQVVNSSLLDKLSLPLNFKNRNVEIIILPINDEQINNKQENLIDNFVGCLAKYKNPDLIPLEKNAWGEAVVDKHGAY